MLHCCGERSISDEVSQLLVNLLDLYAGRVAYPIDEPESVEAKTTVDEVSGRDGWELPTLHGVDENRAASFERFGQIAYGSSQGCLIAAVGSDIVRQPRAVRRAVTKGFQTLIDALRSFMPAQSVAARRKQALA